MLKKYIYILKNDVKMYRIIDMLINFFKYIRQ